MMTSGFARFAKTVQLSLSNFPPAKSKTLLETRHEDVNFRSLHFSMSDKKTSMIRPPAFQGSVAEGLWQNDGSKAPVFWMKSYRSWGICEFGWIPKVVQQN